MSVKPPNGFHGHVHPDWLWMLSPNRQWGTATSERNRYGSGWGCKMLNGTVGRPMDTLRDDIGDASIGAPFNSSNADVFEWTNTTHGLGINIQNPNSTALQCARIDWERFSVLLGIYEPMHLGRQRELTFAFMYQHYQGDTANANRVLISAHDWGTGAGGRPDGRRADVTYNHNDSTWPAVFALRVDNGFHVAILSNDEKAKMLLEPVPIVATWNYYTNPSGRIYFDGYLKTASSAQQFKNLRQAEWIILGPNTGKQNVGPCGIYTQALVVPYEWTEEQVWKWSQDPYGWMRPFQPIHALHPSRICHEGVTVGPAVEHQGVVA